MLMEKFFAKRGTYPGYEMYSMEHLKLVVVSLILVTIALMFSCRMKRKSVLHTIRYATVAMWILEIGKIVFNIVSGNIKSLNSYIPFYFCSLPLYFGLFSGFGKNTVKRIGDVFLIVGGIIGGLVYILSPSTTAGTYPAFHFITVRSFIHHCIMVYLGILMIITNYTNLKLRDIKIYGITVSIAFTIAHILNAFLGTNLMFVTKTNPGTVVDVIYNFSPGLFPVLMTLIHATLPFFTVYACTKLWKSAQNEDEECVHIE